MAKKKENEINDPGEGIRAGVLNLQNVSVKDTGRSLSAVYHRRAIKLVEPFADMVKDDELNASPLSSMKMKGYLRDLRRDGASGLSESAITQIYNSFGADLSNVLAVAKADRRYEDAWRRLITNLEVTTLDLREQLGREVIVAASYSWHYGNFAELLFAPLTVPDVWDRYSAADRDYHTHGLLTMDADTRCRLSDLFFGKDFRMPRLSPKLPDGRKLVTENFEQATLTELMTLEGVALNGSMLGSNGAMTATALKRVKAQTQMAAFNYAPGEWPLDRVELVCLTFFTLLDQYHKKTSPQVDIKQLARFATDNMAKLIIGPIFGSFLPSMQGFLKSWTLTSQAPRVARTVQEILRVAKDDWLDLDNFRMLLLCSSAESNSNYLLLKLFDDEGIRKAKLMRKTDKERGNDKPEPIDWGEEVGLKFAIHWVKYLCAMGLVEIAVDPDAPAADPMLGMRYARLTPLGRYALQIDTQYTPKAVEGNLDVDFDARNSIITVSDKSPYQIFLDKIARRISPTRFRISVNSLIKGCRSKSELEQRISNLRVIIDPDSQPGLKKTVEEALSHTDCAVRDGGYSLLKLRADLPGLREVIMTDKELREMTMLAGPNMALVKTHKMERFNTILASYGFLME